MKQYAFKFFAMVILLVMVAFVTALASVSAQTPGHQIIADIPFEFNVGDDVLPAGQYSVSRLTQDGAGLRISSRESTQGSSRLTLPVRANEPKNKSVLIFTRYGNSYFLSQVWLSGETIGRQMYKSGSERGMERELAKNNAKAEKVTIIAVQ